MLIMPRKQTPPRILDPRRPGYAETDAVSRLSPTSDLWLNYLRDVLGMPPWTLPAVQWVVRSRFWSRTDDPVDTVRKNTLRAIKRMGLTNPEQIANGLEQIRTVQRVQSEPTGGENL